VELASRRLSIVGLADGQHRSPMKTERICRFNGECSITSSEKRSRDAWTSIRHHCDTEVIPHLWGRVTKKCSSGCGPIRHCLVGRAQATADSWARPFWEICPSLDTPGRLASVRLRDQALLASGMVPARPDLRGIDRVFTFSALPAPVTCFGDVRLLPPAVQITQETADLAVKERACWEMPDRRGSRTDPRRRG
jgi:asparagine synthase (glutamine-hydrolysing)